jgi:hypothetical protein
MTDPHDELADQAEADIADLEERTEALGDEVAELKSDDYEDKLKDQIEGAIGEHPEDTDEPEAEGAPKGWA